jgi:hypothetical protein
MSGDNDNEAVVIEREQRNIAPEGGDFEPETDFGRELWALRRKALAEGMTLLSGDEIAAEIAAGRNR